VPIAKSAFAQTASASVVDSRNGKRLFDVNTGIQCGFRSRRQFCLLPRLESMRTGWAFGAELRMRACAGLD